MNEEKSRSDAQVAELQLQASAMSAEVEEWQRKHAELESKVESITEVNTDFYFPLVCTWAWGGGGAALENL